MAAYEAGAEHYAIRGVVEIGVSKDDLRVLAAKLQPQLLEVAGRSDKCPSPDRRRTGEGTMSMSGCSVIAWPMSLPIASDDVKHAGGKADIGKDFAHHHRRREVNSLGFTTIVQPAARMKGTRSERIKKGKFHGVISPTTPIGCE